MYDAIVVGARCTGSPSAMLLARKGYRVLLVDRALFPSDVVNGYYIQQTGGARLQRWGLLDKLRASNCPPLSTLNFDFGAFALRGVPPTVDDVTEGYAPRRTVLDKILVDAAVEAGAELHEKLTVHDLVWEGEQVTGIRGQTKGGALLTERARLVIGADGTHSRVARTVHAPVYNPKPTLTCWYFTHWSKVPAEGIEFYLRNRRVLIAAGTNDGMTIILVGCPYEDFHAFRADIEGNYFKSLDLRDGELLRSIFADSFELDFSDLTEQPSTMLTSDLFVETAFHLIKGMKTLHQITNPRIEVDGDHATGVFDIVAWHYQPRRDGDSEYIARGFYDQRFARQGGQWKIVRHKLIVAYCTGNPKLFDLTNTPKQ